jgi:DNA-binding SARP family transcriptional activator
MVPVRIHLLGALDVDGVDRRALGSRKARLLLARLAVSHGQSVPADRLVDCVWGDALPARPRADLAVLVSRLRAAVGRERLDHDGAGYRLVADWVDLDELSAVAEALTAGAPDGAGRSDPAATAETAARALALVRGRFLDDEPDAVWAEPVRAALDRTVGHVRRVGAAAALAAGQLERAAAWAAAALDADGYDEESLRLLMRAHLAAGRPASALGAYSRVRAALAEELGVSPAAETERCYEDALRATDPGPSDDGGDLAGDRGPRPVGLAGSRGALVGRDVELAALDAALARSSDATEIVAVTGPAGIGKSALVREWSAHARAAGATVLAGEFDPLGRDLPLQAELDALARHLHDHAGDAALVAGPLTVLAPLLEIGGRSLDAPAEPPTPRAGAGADAGVSLVHHALADAFGRLAASRPLVLLLDDAHLAGPSTPALLGHLRRRTVRMLVVATMRTSGFGELPATQHVVLGPLDRAAASALVGAERAARLHQRSGGNPLFLLELAHAPDDELPLSLAAAVTSRLPADPVARAVFETAAVLGTPDVETLARVQDLHPFTVTRHLLAGVATGLLDERPGGFAFHHDLVREAIVAALGPSRRALLHREAARALVADDRREPGAAVAVAEHARLGGDVRLAADAYTRAAELATERHDHEAAIAYLDRALELDPDPGRLVARSRAATLAGRFDDARRDVAAAVEHDRTGEAYEIGAWAAYFARDFGDAASWADDGAELASRPDIAARCLMIGGRIRHATGELGPAESLLEAALARTAGHDHAIAAAWLGVLRSHQSRPADALALLRPAARAAGPADTAAHLHALLFTGHALALSGRPADAVRVFDRFEAEAERRHAVRFIGRGDNFAAWVLRHLGDDAAARSRNERAREHAAASGGPGENVVAAELDLADGALLEGEADAARRHLDRARAAWGPGLVFAWRLDLKVRLHQARLALVDERWDDAGAAADGVAQAAGQLGMPRYAVAARLVAHEARHRRASARTDHDAVARDLTALGDEPEAWWAWARAATVFGVPAWRTAAATRVAALAPAAGDLADTLWRTADRVL